MLGIGLGARRRRVEKCGRGGDYGMDEYDEHELLRLEIVLHENMVT
jgi:hypothetical protein